MANNENIDFISRQHAFIDQRPTLAAHNTDPLAIIRLLRAEIAEFEEAYQKELPRIEIAHEAADIAIFVVTLFKTLDLNIHQEVLTKIRRNESKYPIEFFQNQSFEIGAAMAKKRWIELGGDEKFFADLETDRAGYTSS